jgi:hypothetical protein
MPTLLVPSVLVLGLTVAVAADSITLAIKVFPTSNCAGIPQALVMANDSACPANACKASDFGNETYYVFNACNVSNRFEYAREAFDESTYAVFEENDAGCESLTETLAFVATGSC